MYEYIKGKITERAATFAVIEAGGIGYGLKISVQTSSALVPAAETKIYTYLHVKEDIHALYGFAEKNERELFLLLLSVSGVGPSAALGLLSAFSADDLCQAIMTENVGVIKSAKGIGPKTAQRLILELKDKVSAVSAGSGISLGGSTQKSAGKTQAGSSVKDAVTALMALGFSQAAAERSVAKVTETHGNAIGTEEIIKLALKG